MPKSHVKVFQAIHQCKIKGASSLIFETPANANAGRRMIRRILAKGKMSDDYITKVHGNVVTLERVKVIYLSSDLE